MGSIEVIISIKLACDVPKPDWPMPGEMTGKETKDMSEHIDKSITKA